jgi:hypothetical protein
MKYEQIKLNKFYLIIVLAVAGWFTYATLNGIAYWESSNVIKNTAYHSTGGHRHVVGYGAGFNHK